MKKTNKKTRTQGQVANLAGRQHEKRAINFLKDLIEENQIIPFSVGMKQPEKTENHDCYILREPPFVPYYKGEVTKRSDIFVSFFEKENVRIECKVQNVAGSVDEKILSTLENLKLGKTVGKAETSCVLFLDGDHWKNNPATETRLQYYRDDLVSFNRSSKKKVYLVVGQDEFEELMTDLYLTAAKKRKKTKTAKTTKRAA